MLDHRLGGEDRAGVGEALHPRRDVDGLAEVVEPVVERDREARPLVNADLDQQILFQRPN